MIRLKHCTIERTDYGCTSTFNDGAVVHSVPHPQDPHYFVISHRTGCGDDLLRYAREHDFAHHLLSEALFDAPSPSLFGVAHSTPVKPEEAAIEELGVHALQMWIRCNTEPIVSGIDWHALKARALDLLKAWAE